MKKKFYIRVLYICSSQIICKVETGKKEELDKKIEKQMKKLGEWEF